MNKYSTNSFVDINNPCLSEQYNDDVKEMNDINNARSKKINTFARLIILLLLLTKPTSYSNNNSIILKLRTEENDGVHVTNDFINSDDDSNKKR